MNHIDPKPYQWGLDELSREKNLWTWEVVERLSIQMLWQMFHLWGFHFHSQGKIQILVDC